MLNYIVHIDNATHQEVYIPFQEEPQNRIEQHHILELSVNAQYEPMFILKDVSCY
jgi:hypothetical protein